MTGTGALATVMVIVGTTATIGVANQQNWGGAFGEFGQLTEIADTCKPQVVSIRWITGVGSGSFAETKALVNWSNKAGHYGKKYSSWHNAADRKVKCKTFEKFGVKCTIRGRPCLQKAQIPIPEIF